MKPFSYLFLMSLFSNLSCKSRIPFLEHTADPGIILSTEEQLEKDSYSSRIEEFYESGDQGILTGRADVPIRYGIFRQSDVAKGAIMVSSGRTESMVKYKELIFDLYRNGYSVYILDHRGQGLSGRMTGDPEMGYVDSFQFYVDDMKLFYDQFMKAGNHSKKYLMAHSMGGAIGMSYLEQFPGDFDAAAFSSPMLGLKFPICPLARVLSGKKPRFAPGQGSYHEDSTTFAGNPVTGSKVRYLRMIQSYEQYPEARLGGATIHWVDGSCRQFRTLFRNAEEIRTPFILFSAENEKVVDPGSHRKFIRKALKYGADCQAFMVGDALHELYMEKDGPRSNVMLAALRFYERY